MMKVMISLLTSLLTFLAIDQTDMDREAFRARFKAYKEGKPVSEIYDAGLPKYWNGKLTKQQMAMLDRLYEWGNPLGYDLFSIAGMGGNGLQESGLNPNIVSKWGYSGLFQNNKSLTNAIIDMYGDNSLESQLKYADEWNNASERIRKGKHAAWTAMNAGKFKKKGYASATDAANAWMKFYERPVILDANGKLIGYQQQDKRIAYANAAYDYLFSKYGNPEVLKAASQPIVAQQDNTRVVTPTPQYTYEQTPVTTQNNVIPNRLQLQQPVRTKSKLGEELFSMIFENDEPEDGILYAKNGKLPKYGGGLIPSGGATGRLQFFDWLGQKLRNRMYRTVVPHGYTEDQIHNFISGKSRTIYGDPNVEALYGKYTNQDSIIADVDQWKHPNDVQWRPLSSNEYPDNNNLQRLGKFAVKDLIREQEHNPGSYELVYPTATDSYMNYMFRPHKIGDEDWYHNEQLGWYQAGTKEDSSGVYNSVNDKWDINPFRGSSANDGTIFKYGKYLGLDKLEDIVPFGKPYKIDIRQYVNKYSDGKTPIYIKPANRGKLTRLKARTGKSESELYNDGNPAHKKMVVFARNARKWKH